MYFVLFFFSNKEECYDLLDDIKHNAELLKKTEVEIDRKTKYRSIFAQVRINNFFFTSKLSQNITFDIIRLN